ncbi:MAG TPA: FAD-dependent monooxygenase, partial [Polyangiaceae bacterium]|nr:FAD-dependent monooxygenase [Polyangiaceae bacterium]
MQRRPSETDVLIVGAGPTGLLAALELAARGLTLRVIDKSPQRSGESRAMTVQSRSLEILERFGIAEELVANGRKATRIEVVVTGAPAVAIDLSDVGANDSPYPFGLIVSQAETERCMESRLEAWGVHVERQVELLTCLDGGDGAVAMLKHPDGSQESLRAEYVIGCDGVRSAVRHAAGIGLAGTAFEQDFVIADLDVVWREAGEPSAIRLVFPRSGILAIFPFRDAPLCRIVAAGPNLLPEGGEPTIAQIRAIFERFCPARAELKRPRWTTRYRLHHCVAARYRRGRLFLAGDAAHVQSPAGGQGMNTGLLDAANLAWKVALVVRGVSPETLLDSYEEERRPIGQKLRHFTDRLLSVAAAPSVALSALRNLLVMTALPRIAANPRVRRRLFRFVSQLGVRYTGSSIVSEDLAFADASFLRGPGKGARAPDGPLELPGRGTARLFSR